MWNFYKTSPKVDEFDNIQQKKIGLIKPLIMAARAQTIIKESSPVYNSILNVNVR